MIKTITAAIVAAGLLGACTTDSLPTYRPSYDAAREAGLPIVIDTIYTGIPNSAGGVEFILAVKNVSNKTIKYINYDAVAYNAVGDQVRSEISRSSVRLFQEVGPISPNQRTITHWPNGWYNHSMTCARISKVNIIFTDGTSKTYSSHASIGQLLRTGVSNSCRV